MCVCVPFDFRHFLTENSSSYFKVSCISLQKNLIINGIYPDGEQAEAFWFSEGRTKV